MHLIEIISDRNREIEALRYRLRFYEKTMEEILDLFDGGPDSGDEIVGKEDEYIQMLHFDSFVQDNLYNRRLLTQWKKAYYLQLDTLQKLDSLEKSPNISEGGAATSSFNVVSIKKEDIQPTIDWFADIAGIPSNEFHTLGSTGKIAVSGDIDVALDIRKYDMDKIHKHLMHMLDGRGTYNKGTRVGSYAVPICGERDKGYVQLDIMPSTNIDWTKFAYWSPGENSKYKGMVRNALIRAVVASIHEPGIDVFVVDPNTSNWLVRVGRGFDYHHGIKRMFQVRKQKSNGEYKKALDNSSADEINRLYPELQFDPKEHSIRDPKLATELLFGPGVAPKDIETAEQIIELINKFPPQKKADVIRKVKDNFDRLPKGTVLPEV